MDNKCTYCHRPAGDNAKYSYGMPGNKHVVKCDRWLCTLKQTLISKFKRAVVKVCEYIIHKVKHG